MKRITTVLTLLLIMMLPAIAQPKSGKNREQMRKEMRDFKIKFISQAMEIDGDTQKKFAEVYAAMDQERLNLFRETRRLERKVKQQQEATDADYEAVTKALTDAKVKDTEIERKYDALFKTFLTAKQIFKMKAAEGEFMDRMHKMRKNKK